jgi:hypothetical protein
MNPLPAACALFVVFASTSLAQDKILYRGKYVVPIRLMEVASDGEDCIFDTAEGRVTIPWSALPATAKESFQAAYDKLVKAEADRAKTLKQIAAYLAIGKDPNAAEKIKNEAISLKLIETNLPAYQGRVLWVQGTLSLATYYNYGYRDLQSSHLSLRLVGDGTDAHLYMLRQQSAETRAALLAKEKQDAFCLVHFPAERFDESSSQILATLLFVRPK